MDKIKSFLIMTLLVASVFFVITPVSATCPGVVINEVNFDDGADWIEIYNYGPAIDMGGWTFTWEEDTQNGTYTFPNGFVLGSHSFVQIIEWDDEEYDSPADTNSILYMNHNIEWSEGQENTARILDSSGRCIDYVRMEEGDVDAPVPANCSWGEPNITDTGDSAYIFRNSDSDTDTGRDWTKSLTGTPLALNPGQTGSCSKSLPILRILKILKKNNTCKNHPGLEGCNVI